MTIEEAGKRLGYPKCCIEAFVKGESARGTGFEGEGFLPCSECAKKPPDELTAQINRNRTIKTPFPDPCGWWEDELENDV